MSTFALFVIEEVRAQYVFLGTGKAINSECVELTAAKNYERGWAYASSKFKLDQKDTAEFRIHAGTMDWGADGMVFMIHNDPRGFAAQGCAGEAMGYGSHPSGIWSSVCGYGTQSAITPSVAIEFDTYQNASQGDPSTDHMAYLENGNVNHGKRYANLGNIEDGKEHTFMFTWDPSTKYVRVYLDGVEKLKIRKNIRKRIFGNAKEAYWGFSASTGGANNQQYFCTNEDEPIIFGDNVSVLSGESNNPLTWLNGVPKSGDAAVILSDHIVNMSQSWQVGSINVAQGGELKVNDNKLALDNGDLTVNGSISVGNGSVLMNGTEKQNISVKKATDLKNVTINNSAGVEVSNETLYLSGTLSLENGDFNTNDKLRITSSGINQSGRIGPIAVGASLTGEISMERYIYSSNRIYRYMSSPVQDATLADWHDQIPITGYFDNPSTGPGISTNSPSVYTYNENSSGIRESGYTAYPTSGTTADNPINVGQGYAVYVRDNIERPNYVDVTGTTNTGDISLPVAFTDHGDIENDGWNLLGNPYPSQIDWDNIEIARRPNVDNAIYYTDNDNPSKIKRSYVNGIGNPIGTSGIIAPFQGFWVKANATNPSLTIIETDKSAASFNFYKNETSTENAFRIRFSHGSGSYDETVIRFSTEATRNFDIEWDAYKLDQSIEMISTLSQDGEKLSINSMPVSTDDIDTIQIVLANHKIGQNNIRFTKLDKLDASISLKLVDQYTNEVIDLHNQKHYFFNIEENNASQDSNRFYIIADQKFINDNTNVVEEPQENEESTRANGIKIYPNPSRGETVQLDITDLSEGNVEITLTDLNGFTLYTENFANNNAYIYKKLDLSNYATGIYIVKVKTGAETRAERIIIE